MRGRRRNDVISVINTITSLLSVPTIGGGIWLSIRANNTDCMKVLQYPLIIIGLSMMITSLTGLAGAYYRKIIVMWGYLVVMFVIILAFIGFMIFARVVTQKGSGRVVENRAYMEYYLGDYSGWLQQRVASHSYWEKISTCVRDSEICASIGRTYHGVPETADAFYLRKLTPIQGGCCKPPTECAYIYQNETMWIREGEGTVVENNTDCRRWSNDQQMLCYGCDSCKAGVLANLKNSWGKVSMINVVVFIILLIVYVIAYVAYRSDIKMDNHYPFGVARMIKLQPPSSSSPC